MAKTLRFIVCVFGEEHQDFLLANIYSIRKSNPKANITVIWHNDDPTRIRRIARAFPKVDFIELKQTFTGKINYEIIPQVTRLKHFAAHKYKGENICQADTDMLVLKDLSHYFKRKFDLIFTYTKPGSDWAVNAGMLLYRNNKVMRKFFDLWLADANRILKDQKLLEEAIRLGGAGDQWPVIKLLQSDDYKGKYVRKIAGMKITYIGIPCSELNETDSVPITKEKHVLHYKGGWHKMILEGTDFTKHRPRETSQEMYDFWYKNYRAAEKELLKWVYNPEDKRKLLLAACKEVGAEQLFIERGSPFEKDAKALGKEITTKVVRKIPCRLHKKTAVSLRKDEKLAERMTQIISWNEKVVLVVSQPVTDAKLKRLFSRIARFGLAYHPLCRQDRLLLKKGTFRFKLSHKIEHYKLLARHIRKKILSMLS